MIVSRVGTSLALALLCATGALAGGCDAGSGDESPASSAPTTASSPSSATAGSEPRPEPPDPDETVRPAWTTRLDVLTQPEVVGRVGVVLARTRRDEIDIVGLDTDDGRVRWRHPFSPGDVLVGTPLDVVVVRGAAGRRLVVFQRPGEGRRLRWRAPVVAVDAATGRVVHRSEPVRLATEVVDCDGGGACFTVRYPSTDAYTRLDVRDGSLDVLPDQAPTFARSIGEAGLYGDNVRPEESLGVLRGGRTLWQRRVDEMFGPGYGSDWGWSFDLDRATGTYHGYLGWAPPGVVDEYTFEGESGARRSLESRRILGFSARTGRTRWRLDRAIPVDGCPGVGVPDRRPGTADAVACYFRGDVDVRGERWLVDEFGLLGFDRGSGRVRWRVPAGRTDALALDDDGYEIVHGDDLVLRRGARVVLVDPVDGEVTPTPRDAVWLCEGRRLRVDYALPDANDNTRRDGHRAQAPCRSDGDPVRWPTRGALEAGAVPAPGGVRLYATRQGVVGYALGAALP